MCEYRTMVKGRKHLGVNMQSHHAIKHLSERREANRLKHCRLIRLYKKGRQRLLEARPFLNCEFTHRHQPSSESYAITVCLQTIGEMRLLSMPNLEHS